MDNIHLKNLNSKKILKELSKNPKAYLSYIFKQNINGKYIALYQFKKLPIIEEFDNEIIKIIYEITKEKISTLDKIINLIAFEYNKKFLYSYYKRDEITNNQIAQDLLDYLIEHYLLHNIYTKKEVNKINTTINKKYNELISLQPRVPNHCTINHIIKLIEFNDKKNNENNIEDLQNEFKNIMSNILNNPNMNMLNRISHYIFNCINDNIINPYQLKIYYNLNIYNIIKDTVKKNLIVLKKLKVLKFDEEILK